METYECYHGTSEEAALSIISEQRFISSTNDREWVGHGIYFFIDPEYDSIPCSACDNAYKWARYIKRHRSPVVIKGTVKINSDDILDLRDENQLSMFDEFRLEIFKEARRRANRRGLNIEDTYSNKLKLDCFAINELCQSADPPFLAVITKTYINFYARIGYPASQYPNCTILCLRNETLIHNISLVNIR